MRVNTGTTRRARIEMLPLIDIVFLLLVFFIYAMLSMAVHRGLPVALPESETAMIDKKLVLSVTLKRDGTMFVDREAVPLEELSDKLKNKAAKSGEAGALIFADREVSYQRLFQVLDRVKKAGIERISLQAEGSDRPQD